MARPPLLTLSDIRLSFGGTPIFTGVELAISKGERAALVGRNGAGKSTLMKLIAGIHAPDTGEVWVQPGTRVVFLSQEPDFSAYDTLLAFAEHGLDERFRAEAELTEMGLSQDGDPKALSGGQLRRAALARAFAHDPDILLMDEPTNHLDVETIERLETRLKGFKGALLMVSHDRRFLENVSTNVLWLRQGEVLKSPEGYASFDNWADSIEAEEEKTLRRMDTQLKGERRWLERGVTGRRKRNQGRLARMKEMRREHAALRERLAGARAGAELSAESGEVMSKRIIEVKDVSKRFETPHGAFVAADGLSLNILRGDRIGLVGPNGSGKTTLLKLLLGTLAPDEGRIKRSKAIEIAYLDQTRESLKARDTLWETLAPNGGDTIDVQGRPRHVAGYAKDFLFDPSQLRQPVGALSGGERNRLTLAVALARRSDLLVLDEPTNDLDMQTLDLLEDMLVNYAGTLLLVSHDRAFLDATVTSCLVPLGGGRWRQVPGGWEDAVREVPGLVAPVHATRTKRNGSAQGATRPGKPDKPQKKLSFKQKHRLKEIEADLPKLSEEIEELEAHIADPEAYARDPEAFTRRTERLAAARAEKDAMEEEWLELEALREEFAS